jgi:hypothetical protein
MRRTFSTDEQMERELEELKRSPYVALARREQRLKYKQRQQLYTLRNLEKRGRELAAIGVTVDTIDEHLEALEQEEAQQAMNSD